VQEVQRVFGVVHEVDAGPALGDRQSEQSAAPGGRFERLELGAERRRLDDVAVVGVGRQDVAVRCDGETERFVQEAGLGDRDPAAAEWRLAVEGVGDRSDAVGRVRRGAAGACVPA